MRRLARADAAVAARERRGIQEKSPRHSRNPESSANSHHGESQPATQPRSAGDPAARDNIHAGQPLNEQGGSMARRRFQKGRLFLRSKRTPAWIGRWREDTITPGGSGHKNRKVRAQILGSKAELPTRRLAARRLELLLARINAPSYRPRAGCFIGGFRGTLEVQSLGLSGNHPHEMQRNRICGPMSCRSWVQ